MSENQLSFINEKLPSLLHLDNLKNLDLSQNDLRTIPSDLFEFHACKVNLQANQISLLKFSDLRQRKNIHSCSRAILSISTSDYCLDLSGNPLVCEGILIFLLSTRSHSQMANTLYAGYGSYVNFQRHCPDKCDCHGILPNGPLFSRNMRILKRINCNRRNLTTAPEIIVTDPLSYGIEYQQLTIQLDISKNRLTELSKWRNKQPIATFIQASYNQISEIQLENLPPNLRGLDVSYNNILSIASNVLDHFKNPSFEVILFEGNPFECSCWSEGTEKLIEFAEEYKAVTDLHEAKCNADYELSRLAHNDNCSNKAFTLMIIIFSVLMAVLSITLVVFYKYQQFIKMWLFAHNTCLWWVDEEYLDRDLEFDAFVCYSQKDVLYTQHLVNELENGTPNYKLFLHERHFRGGEPIVLEVILLHIHHRHFINLKFSLFQVHNAIAQCRRTIIILSRNFLESQWPVYEFSCAYNRSVAEKRNRLIVVKYGDIEHDAEMDETIRLYLKTYTYIESNDRWFWEKIRYALPHRRRDD